MEASKSDLYGLIGYITTQAKAIVANGEQVLPVLFLLNGTFLKVCPLDMSDDKSKDGINEAVKMMIKKSAPDAVAIVSEGWMVQTKELPDVMPSKHPDRKECIVVSASSPQWEISQTIVINRTPLSFEDKGMMEDAECRFFEDIWMDKVTFN